MMEALLLHRPFRRVIFSKGMVFIRFYEAFPFLFFFSFFCSDFMKRILFDLRKRYVSQPSLAPYFRYLCLKTFLIICQVFILLYWGSFSYLQVSSCLVPYRVILFCRPFVSIGPLFGPFIFFHFFFLRKNLVFRSFSNYQGPHFQGKENRCASEFLIVLLTKFHIIQIEQS